MGKVSVARYTVIKDIEDGISCNAVAGDILVTKEFEGELVLFKGDSPVLYAEDDDIMEEHCMFLDFVEVGEV